MPLNQRVKGRRARRACLHCRARKVRCDISLRNPPCTNCQLDQVECLAKDRGTGRTRRPQYTDRAFDDGTSPQSHTAGSAESQTYTPDRRQCPGTSASIGTSVAPEIYSDVVPSCIRPLPPHMSGSVADLLQAKGALKVPVAALRDVIWKAYLRHVQPSLPLLDVQKFSSAMNDPGAQKSQISLLLYQAVMFAGFLFVDLSDPYFAGLHSRKDILKSMFENIKLLYDFDYEQDPICLIQSLLLMTMWYRSPDDHKDPWHYVGLAASMAKRIGLDRQSVIAAADPELQPLLRRLWWCCVVRDYLLANGLGRPTHLNCRGGSIHMLSLSDFNLNGKAQEIGFPANAALASEYAAQQKLAALFIEQTKLCTICHVYLERHPLEERSEQPGAQATSHQTSTDNIHNTEVGATAVFEYDLQQWLSGLPDEASLLRSTIQDDDLTNDVALHYYHLHMLYNAAIMSAHRRYVMPGGSPSKIGTDLAAVQCAEVSREKVTQAADRVTDICRVLRERNIVKLLPVSGITCVLVTMVIHILRINFSNSPPSSTAADAISMLADVLTQLREKFTYLDFIWGFLDASFQTASRATGSTRKLDEPRASGGDHASHLGRQGSPSQGRNEFESLHIFGSCDGTNIQHSQQPSDMGMDKASNSNFQSLLDTSTFDPNTFLALSSGGDATTAADDYLGLESGDISGCCYEDTLGLFSMNQDPASNRSGQSDAASFLTPIPKHGYGDIQDVDDLSWFNTLACSGE